MKFLSQPANPSRLQAACAVVGGLVACGLVAGCSPAPSDPTVRRLVPDFGWTGEVTNVTLVGEHLFPEVVVGDKKDEAQINSSFQVVLETDPPTQLDAVQFVDASTLTAEVPAGVAPGVYDVEVVTPSGSVAPLSQAFQVTETRAAQLLFDVSAVGYDVTQTAVLAMHVADPEGGAVAQPILVDVRADSDQGAAGVQFGDGLLDNQITLPNGVGIEGNLHADGTAPLLLQSSVAQDLTLTLAAVDEPTIAGDSTLLSFAPGVPNHVVFTFPSDNFSTAAGVEVPVGIDVVDASGNVINATGLKVAVLEDSGCGQGYTTVDLLQAGPYPFTFTKACTGDHLHAVAFGIDDTESAAFNVVPAAVDHYGVAATPSSIVAGRGVLAVQVDAQDPYGNLVTDYVGVVSLHDSVGGLDKEAGVGTQSCDPVVGGQTVCTATPIRAATGILITASDGAGLSGVSNAITVTPDAADSLAMTVGTATAEAGVPFAVGIELLDAWDNQIVYGSEAPVFSDETGTLACLPSTDGNYTCTITQSDAADVISAVLEGLPASSAPFQVTNADLGLAEVTLSETAIDAGQSFSATLHGYDAYGNAYTTAVSGSAIGLADKLGGMTPLDLVLDPSGSATATVSLTTAGSDALVATASGATIGQSSPILVSAGTVVGLSVTAPPWADVGAAVPVDVSGVDTWGNVSFDYAGPVDVSLAGCTTTTVSSFPSGVGEADLTCATPAFAVVANGSDGALTASSDAVDLLDFDCADGPTAAFTLDGTSSAVACLVAGSVTMTLDPSGTSSGAASLAVWHLDGGTGDSRTTTAPDALTFEAPTATTVSFVVADSEACASEATAEAWVGENDGSAVGPITLTPTNASVRNGAATAVSVAATDCAGDVASGAEVYVWTNLGDLSGATSTGSGLTVGLDAAGAGTFSVAFLHGYAGTATVSASSADASGFGSASVTVTEDSVKPTVVSVTPAGVWTDAVSAVTIGFSERMLPGSLSAASATLTGPTGILPTTVSLSTDAETLTITPTTAIDPTSGTFTVALSTNVRDVAGNRISGDWSGNTAAWSSTFGAVASTVGTVSAACDFNLLAFRPDGDPGVGSEADAVVVGLAPASAPTWWALTVSDADGTAVRRTRVTGASATVTWDGRGDDGIVSDEGTYTVAVAALDATSNAGDACAASVALTQRGRAP